MFIVDGTSSREEFKRGAITSVCLISNSLVPGFGQGITEVRLRNSEWSGDRNLLANPNEISPNNYSK